MRDLQCVELDRKAAQNCHSVVSQPVVSKAIG